MWKSFFSFWILFGVLTATGQEEQSPTEDPPPKFKPYELKLGINALRTGSSLLGADRQSHEVQAALALHQYNVVVDVGVSENTFGEAYDYANKGSYFRAGVDWNFTKDKASGNVFSMGLRYAQAGFEDELSFTSDQGFGEQPRQFANTNLTARWAEVVVNLRGKLVSNLYMGFTLRWQTFRSLSGEETLKAYEIPGFGLTKRENSTAFDYYIMWRIPFEKFKTEESE